MPKPLTYNATLVDRVDLTTALSIFKIRADDYGDSHGPFDPGQYVTLGMNNEKKVELGSVRRPMSIVSAPEEHDYLEFYIRYVNWPESDNPLTHLMWEIQAGDRMFMRPKPVGRFSLEETIGTDDHRLKILVAAGTGLAPFVSMVRSPVLRDPSADLSEFVILHGASYPADLGYREELEGYRQNNSLNYFATISRPQEAPDWDGDIGRVEAFFQPDRLVDLEARLGLEPGGLTPEKATVFICGLQGTIGETVTGLASRGFVPENRRLRKALSVPEDAEPSLFFEQYDTTPVIDFNDPEVIDPLREQLREALEQQNS